MNLRSSEYTDPAYVRFVNKTGRSLDVIWFNYSGNLIKYGYLDPYQFLDVNTFKTHPWMFVDRETGERMQVGSGTIFYPSTSREIGQRLRLNVRDDFRFPISIVLPMFTLRQLSLQTIIKNLQNADGIDSLDLPVVLVNDIQEMLRKKESMYD